jgi:uncharacterized protein YceK
MLRAVFAISLVSILGCGTTTCFDVAEQNPKTQLIYGGVRTDLNCILDYDSHVAGDRTMWIHDPLGKYTLKTCSVIDLPLSLAADTVLLPYAIWKTSKSKSLLPPDANEIGKVDEQIEK